MANAASFITSLIVQCMIASQNARCRLRYPKISGLDRHRCQPSQRRRCALRSGQISLAIRRSYFRNSASSISAIWCAAKPWSSNLNPLAPLYRIADAIRYRKHGDTGRRGEDLAHRYLRRNGFVIVARNWRPPQGGGEIDIIAWECD